VDWWVIEYSSLMRRLIDAEYRQVYKLQHTHTNSAQRTAATKVAKRTGEAECEGDMEFGVLPQLRYDTARPRVENYKVQRQRRAQRRRRVRGGGGLWLLLQCNTTRPHHEARSDNESDLKILRNIVLNSAPQQSHPGMCRTTRSCAYFFRLVRARNRDVKRIGLFTDRSILINSYRGV